MDKDRIKNIKNLAKKLPEDYREWILSHRLPCDFILEEYAPDGHILGSGIFPASRFNEWTRELVFVPDTKLSSYPSLDNSSIVELQNIIAKYIAAANPQAVLELIADAEYAAVLQKERDAYYKAFDKLAVEIGVFKQTDPGKPETFDVFANEYRKLKAAIERLEKENDWLIGQLVDAAVEDTCPVLQGKDDWHKAASKATEIQE